MRSKLFLAILFVAFLAAFGNAAPANEAEDIEFISVDDWEASNEANRAAAPSHRWINIMRKSTPSGNAGLFDVGWEAYKKGFGNSEKGDYWMGLEKMHQLTSTGNWDVLITYRGMGEEGRVVIYKYHNFKVESEFEFYRLHVGSLYQSLGAVKKFGNAGQFYQQLNGMFFSTKDRDNDFSDKNCAKSWHGGFWYKYCMYGNYTPTDSTNGLRSSLMAIRPA